MEGYGQGLSKEAKLVVWFVGLLFALLLFFIFKPFTIIDSGERGVVLRWGAVTRIMDEGFNWKTPIVESVVIFEVRTQIEEVSASASSKDLQDVSTEFTVNYNLDPTMVGDIYRELQTDYKRRVLSPAIQDSIKEATAKFTAEELVTQREAVKNAIEDSLKTRLAVNHIIVTETFITNFQFSASFNAAIEAKVTAEQEALKAENELERVKFEQQQEIEKYKAQAEQTKLQNEALKTGTQFLELKKLEVQMEYAKQWDGVLPTTFVPGSAIPFIDVLSTR